MDFHNMRTAVESATSDELVKITYQFDRLVHLNRNLLPFADEYWQEIRACKVEGNEDSRSDLIWMLDSVLAIMNYPLRAT